MLCLKVEIEGLITDITPQAFKYYNLNGAKVISGDKYYIDKAVTLGAIKPKKKKPKE